VRSDRICSKCHWAKASARIVRLPGKQKRDRNEVARLAAMKPERREKKRQSDLERRRRDPQVLVRSVARWRERNPEAFAAHSATHRALKQGSLQRQPCEVCRAEKTEAHHDDYTKPLAVRWLCRVHHKEWHRKYGPGKTSADYARTA
jgi:hypothetical protein